MMRGRYYMYVLPTSSPHRVGLLAGICWTKSQCPRYSPGLGGRWLQMNSAQAGKLPNT